MTTRVRFRLVRAFSGVVTQQRASTDGHAVYQLLRREERMDQGKAAVTRIYDGEQGLIDPDHTFIELEVVLPASLDVPGLLEILTPLMAQHAVLPESWTVDTI